jgi:hypothetical protein
MKDSLIKYGFELIVFLALFFAPISNALFAVGVLIVFDTVTGIWAAVHNGGWASFVSSKFKRIVPKLLLYPLVIIVAKVAEDYLLMEIPWIRVSTGLLAAVEVKSIYENISVVLGFDIWNKFQDTIVKLRKEDKDAGKQE